MSRPECGAATVCPGANSTYNTMSNTHNPPAFPTPSVVAPDGTEHDNGQEGMSLRDYFAAQALTGLFQIHGKTKFFSEFAREAYDLADAMLKARNA